MMQVISDLQLHSKYSRAVSQEMILPKMGEWAKKKGIELLATGDWTHPLWMREIKNNLEEMGNGLLKLKVQSPASPAGGEKLKVEEGPYFLLATEVSSIYSQGGKLRRIHTLIWAPSIATAEKINKELISRGANLMADGRPIIGLSSIQVAELVFTIDPKSLIIPAHIWTPWFSLYGSESGFDSIDEAFGAYAKYIYAIETGLSSDPAMNWRIKELDNRSIVSFSDAHSGPKLGREATVFELAELNYENIRRAIMHPAMTSDQLSVVSNQQDKESKTENRKLITDNRILYTIEFYPEEGKYHYTGHRNCGIKQTPQETRSKGIICPVCGRRLTVGVMHRVDELAGRTEEELQISNIKYQISNKKTEIRMIKTNIFPDRPAYIMMVPLQEILSEVLKSSTHSQTVQNEYKKLIDNFGGEFETLQSIPLEDITRISGPMVADGVGKVRNGEITIDPGYDGVFGVVKIWGEEKKEEEKKKEQLSLF